MKRFVKPIIYFLMIAGIVFMLSTNIIPENTKEEISYTEFLEKAEYGDIEKIEMDGSTITAYEYNNGKTYTVKYVEDQDFVKEMREQQIEVSRKNQDGFAIFSVILSVVRYAIPFLFVLFFLNKMFQPDDDEEGGGIGGFNIFNSGKSKVKLYKQTDTGVKFSDVAGQEEAKESLTEIIDYLHNADKYSSIGAKLPKGALLIGPPGTGKTLLAKAVAGEANVPFYSITGSDFVEMFVGVGASRVRDMFAEAKKNSPCIVFIDEIDAIGKSRAGSSRAAGNDEREQTLNQLLSEMDGFDSTTAVVVLAATNRPEILDKALTRPGRFDRRVIVDKPDLKGREDILKVHAKNVLMDESVDLSAIAKATAGGVGADLSNIINEAALRAVRMKRELVTQEDLMESVELVFAGKEKKDRALNEKEREIVAYHEVGHAVVAALQKNSEPVQKITIVPRTSGALGYTLQVPEEEKFLSSREEMLEEIRTLIGGRCAEEVFFNLVTTGASNDIEKITKLAKEMVTIYGMSSDFDMIAFASQESIYLDTDTFRTCSEEYSAAIDAEMLKIVKSCHMEVKNMLSDNAELVHEVAAILLKKENINGEEFMEIFRKYHDETYSWTPMYSEKDVKDIKTTPLQPRREIIVPEAGKPATSKKQAPFEPPKPLKRDDKPDKQQKKPDRQPVDNADTAKTENPGKNNPPTPGQKESLDKKQDKKDLSAHENTKPERQKPADSETEAKAEGKQNKGNGRKEDRPDSFKNGETPDKKENQAPVKLGPKSEPIPEQPSESEALNDLEEPPEDIPEQGAFEDDVLAQMEFDSAMNMEDPPMPNFDAILGEDKTKKVVDTPTEKNKIENKPAPQSQEKQKDSGSVKTEQKSETAKPKPAFEAPKPLSKKKKKGQPGQKDNPVKQEAPQAKEEPVKPQKKEDAEAEKKESPKQNRDDMSLLMDSLKSNPEALVQAQKKKYINLNHSKKPNPDVLTPESNPADLKNADTSEFDLNKRPNDEFSEDDY